MSDDMLLHFSSNSSNQSDQSLPTKIAKLEARMVGKASSAASPAAAIAVQPAAQQQQPAWSSVVSSAVKFVSDELAEPSTSSDSDDDVRNPFLVFVSCDEWTLIGIFFCGILFGEWATFIAVL